MSDFTKKRLKGWIIALAVIAAVVTGIFVYLQTPPSWRITPKDMEEGLIRAGRAVSNPPPAVFVPIEIKRPVRLAIGSLGFDRNGQNENIQDLVLARLTGAPGLELVERQSLERVLRELDLSLAGLVRARDALRAGKLVKADWFLLGTAVKVAGTNSLVLRIVDARTGIMRDARVISAEAPATEIASEIADFAGASRQSAAKPQLRSFLAIGTFRDLSINQRQAAFPQQLRSYLMAAYRGSDVTLLEREAVDTLLQEVRLDLAGLAEGSATNAPQPMQSAYWLVNGTYQSYETTNFQVELDLEVTRAFGPYQHVFLREEPNEPLFAKIKSAIDGQLQSKATVRWPTRNSEARLQMLAGKELAGGGDLIFPQYNWGMDAAQAAKYRFNMGEAIRAFETALLLEPTNRETKLCLAACIRRLGFSRMEEARSLYREVIEEPVRDRWTGTAQQALHYSFEWDNAEDKARWYRSAIESVTNAEIARNYRDEAEAAEKAMALNQGGAKAQEIAEAELLEKMTNAVMGHVYGPMGIDNFVAAFGSNAAARRLVELYPAFKAKSPDAAPYLLAAIVTAQVDTNAAIVAEFQQLLDAYAEHPDATAKSEAYWEHIWRSVCEWSFEHKMYRMAATVLEDENRATAFDPFHNFKLRDEQKMTLAYAYFNMADWSKALDIFQTYSNRPVEIGNGGPWGEAFSVVLTSEHAANCRKKLGLPPVVDSRQFEMGKDCLCMCTASAFIADDSGLWIGIAGQLLHLSFNLETNLVVRLPVTASAAISSIALTSSNVWISTAGEGLIEYDKGTGKCRHFNLSDGLTTESITCAQVLGDKLWLGYGRLDWRGRPEAFGRGVGYLDLATRKLTSFTVSMAPVEDNHGKVGQSAHPDTVVQLIPQGVSAIGGRAEEVWFAADNLALRRYRVAADAWDAPNQVGAVSSITTDGNRLFAGQSWPSYEDTVGPIGLAVVNLKDLKVQGFGALDGMPAGAVTALAWDGSDLWAGGKGYIALLDTKEFKMRKIAYITSTVVDRIQIAGGYVWAQYNWRLHRAALSGL